MWSTDNIKPSTFELLTAGIIDLDEFDRKVFVKQIDDAARATIAGINDNGIGLDDVLVEIPQKVLDIFLLD